MDKHQYTRFCFLSICIGSIALVFAISRCSISFFDYSLRKLEFSFPESELRRSFYNAGDENRVVDSRDVVSQQILSVRSSNSTLRIKPEKNKKKKLNRRRMVEVGLSKARASIREAASSNRNATLFSVDLPNTQVYRNPSALHQSYLEMEKRFKVYVYEEGEPPLVHDGPCKSVYAVEGRFIMEMEKSRTKFRTYDPDQAHVYFLPFSVTLLVKYLYEGNFDATPLRTFASDYISLISSNHPFWNRTSGADHFMLACHDWGPLTSKANKDLFNKSIRVMCNANSSEGFNPVKDATLPEIKLYGGEVDRKLRLSETLTASPRPHLAFFAGGVHGPVRPILLHHWKQRDPDMPVFEYLPKHLNFYDFMRSSKFCLCPSGYEVASPRLIEAIYSECIPVILSVNFVLPFSDILRWETFSVQVDVSEIPRLKEILMSISDEKYERLKRNLRYVRRHFELNDPPKRYDAFHMILHSIWLRRLNLRLT
ncbi:glycosyltransferase [Hirschfeldia incana]|nr:glycosyltransferase [Hirschfeldia incana]